MAEQPQMLKHRLGVDTGAYATGVLSAVRLYGEEQRLMQARAQGWRRERAAPLPGRDGGEPRPPM